MELDTTAVSAGVRLIVFDAIGSTNTEALARARAGEHGQLWVVAHVQLAGRGRRGREWNSAPGNLCATLLLTDPSSPDVVAQLSFVASLAVHDAILESAPALGPRLAVKWPNDVLCDGAKISGILLEGEGVERLVVALGVGLNCIRHPTDTEFPATDLAEAGAHVPADVVFRVLSRTMLQRIAQWQRGFNFSAIRADWLERADGLGKALRVRLHERELTGIFKTLDDRGRLILRRDDGGYETVTAGDVFPLGLNGMDRD